MNNIINKETINVDIRPLIYIDYMGNVAESEEKYQYVLVNESQEEISRRYDYTEELNDDHYIVSSAVAAIDRHNDEVSPRAEFKFGVIRLTRDDNGKVIPFNEKIVVPFIYDGIKSGEENTAIAAIIHGKSNRFTYIDLDLESKNYGKQLLPVGLKSASWFGRDYKGFAECEFALGGERYIPRNYEPRQEATYADLLTKEEVECLLHDTPKVKMKKLTGGYTKAEIPKK